MNQHPDALAALLAAAREPLPLGNLLGDDVPGGRTFSDDLAALADFFEREYDGGGFLARRAGGELARALGAKVQALRAAYVQAEKGGAA